MTRLRIAATIAKPDQRGSHSLPCQIKQVRIRYSHDSLTNSNTASLPSVRRVPCPLSHHLFHHSPCTTFQKLHRLLSISGFAVRQVRELPGCIVDINATVVDSHSCGCRLCVRRPAVVFSRTTRQRVQSVPAPTDNESP